MNEVITITVLKPTNTISDVREIGEILYKLRLHTKFWEKYGGYSNKKKVQYWENKADEWILNHVSITEKK